MSPTEEQPDALKTTPVPRTASIAAGQPTRAGATQEPKPAHVAGSAAPALLDGAK